jgi:hypothetical protein
LPKPELKSPWSWHLLQRWKAKVSEKRVRQLLRQDPRLALAKVRIDLEESLKRLYRTADRSGTNLRRTSISRMIETLVRQNILNQAVADTVREVITLSNRAIHGEPIEPGASEELAVLGAELVEEIQHANLERLLTPIEKTVITSEELGRYESSRYRVTTVVPLVEKPTRNVYIFDQLALESFLEGYEEYAEFIVAIEQT